MKFLEYKKNKTNNQELINLNKQQEQNQQAQDFSQISSLSSLINHFKKRNLIKLFFSLLIVYILAAVFGYICYLLVEHKVNDWYIFCLIYLALFIIYVLQSNLFSFSIYKNATQSNIKLLKIHQRQLIQKVNLKWLAGLSFFGAVLSLVLIWCIAVFSYDTNLTIHQIFSQNLFLSKEIWTKNFIIFACVIPGCFLLFLVCFIVLLINKNKNINLFLGSLAQDNLAFIENDHQVIKHQNWMNFWKFLTLLIFIVLPVLILFFAKRHTHKK